MKQVKANEHPFCAEVPLRLRPFVEILLDNADQDSSGRHRCTSSAVHGNDSIGGVNHNRSTSNTVSERECRSWEDSNKMAEIDHMETIKRVWLITGSASGLGREIAQAALAAGERVVATARRPEELRDLESQYGESVRALRQDVRIAEDADAAVAEALQAFGRLDVVVNNAGYGRFAPFEQLSAEDFHDIVDTCFYGVVHTTRAALPVMRKQRSGIIFQVSSVGGRITRPGNSAYLAAKWAVSGFAEALASETAAFGVQVCALEPGGIRTNWGKRANTNLPELLPEYNESVGGILRALASLWGNENSDPRRIGELIVKLADETSLPPHLVLGSDALTYLSQADEERTALARKWVETSRSVDFREAAGAET